MLSYIQIPTVKALRYNQGKPEWTLVDFPSFEPGVRVLMYGANKYTVKDDLGNITTDGRNNWKNVMPRQQILDCMARHLFALMSGEENDPESGLPHIGHLQCNAMFYSYHNTIKNKDAVQNTQSTRSGN